MEEVSVALCTLKRLLDVEACHICWHACGAHAGSFPFVQDTLKMRAFKGFTGLPVEAHIPPKLLGKNYTLLSIEVDGDFMGLPY